MREIKRIVYVVLMTVIFGLSWQVQTKAADVASGNANITFLSFDTTNGLKMTIDMSGVSECVTLPLTVNVDYGEETDNIGKFDYDGNPRVWLFSPTSGYEVSSDGNIFEIKSESSAVASHVEKMRDGMGIVGSEAIIIKPIVVYVVDPGLDITGNKSIEVRGANPTGRLITNFAGSSEAATKAAESITFVRNSSNTGSDGSGTAIATDKYLFEGEYYNMYVIYSSPFSSSDSNVIKARWRDSDTDADTSRWYQVSSSDVLAGVPVDYTYEYNYVTGIDVSDLKNIVTGKSILKYISITDKDNNSRTGNDISWTSDPVDGMTISSDYDGFIMEATLTGTYNLKASVADGLYPGKAFEKEFEVKAVAPIPTDICLNRTSLTMNVGDSCELAVDELGGYDANAYELYAYSDDVTKATVSIADGKVRVVGVGRGTTAVKVKVLSLLEGGTDSEELLCTVTVRGEPQGYKAIVDLDDFTIVVPTSTDNLERVNAVKVSARYDGSVEDYYSKYYTYAGSAASFKIAGKTMVSFLDAVAAKLYKENEEVDTVTVIATPAYKDSSYNYDMDAIGEDTTDIYEVQFDYTENVANYYVNGEKTDDGFYAFPRLEYAVRAEGNRGYTFDSWIGRSDKTETISYITNSDDILMAKYKNPISKNYSIVFNGNGATTGSMKSMSCTRGKTYYINANAFARKGYIFKEWNLRPDGSGMALDNCAKIKNLTDGNSVTLYAQWKKVNTAKEYTIKFNGNGATSGSMPKMECKTGKAYKLLTNKYKKKGYAFVGWCPRKDGKGIIYANKSVVADLATSRKQVVLYAQWKPIKYSISFFGNGATSGDMDDMENITYGKSVTLKKNKYSKKGYKFVGWATSRANASKGKVAYKNGVRIKNLTTTNGKTINLYAVWKKK